MAPRRIVIACCTGVGLLLAAPFTLAHLRHELAWGTLREVFVRPMGDGTARLSVAYEFSVGGRWERGERIGGTTWLAWDRDGGWGSPAADPVLPEAEARREAERLRAGIRGRTETGYRVLYAANDPAGSAFIQLGRIPAVTTWRIGMLCVACSLVLCLPFPRRRRRAASAA